MKILEGRPRSYDREINRVSRGRIKAIKEIVASEVVGAKRVLEIGCGTGELAEMMVSQGNIVHGFDINASMVEMVRERINREHLKDKYTVKHMGVDGMDSLPSDLDPFLARLGIGAIGNINFAGTVRTEILNGYRKIHYDNGKCVGCFCCIEVCPQGCWEMGEDKRAVFSNQESCTVCRACFVQCETHAIKAEPVR